MRVAVLSAYSADNSGDGLLVRLALDAVWRNFGKGVEVDIVAADVESFPHEQGVRYFSAPVMGDRGRRRFVAALGRSRSYAALTQVLAQADLILGVGGGYMRSKGWLEHLKLMLGHQEQLRCAISSGVPLICLPQSIGPFFANEGGSAQLYRDVKAVFVRDDRSLDLLARNGCANVFRCPDMAVQEVARKINEGKLALTANKRIPESVCLVLRKPPQWGRAKQMQYEENVSILSRMLASQCRVTYAVQSSTRGNDDVEFYRSRKIGRDYKSLRQCLSAETRPDVVVSVRLHGALEAILAGIPAYHISYERKGFGAYEDLCSSGWVCNGSDFQPEAVVERIFTSYALEGFAKGLMKGIAGVTEMGERMDAQLQRYAR